MVNATSKNPSECVDFRAVFEASSSAYLLVAADPPRFTILAANPAYLAATMTEVEGPHSIIGRGVFEVFYDNPDDPDASGEEKVRSSFETVIRTKAADAMAVVKYDVPLPAEKGGGFDERYWSPVNTPVFDDSGRVAQILNRADDVTAATKLAMRHEALVTLCAWTKAVKYEGKWLSFEEYMLQRFGLTTSHAISPAALERLMADVEPELHPG